LLEGLALVPLAGSFSDAKQFDDFTANPVNVLSESVFLNIEGKALSFLFSAAYPSECDKSFYGPSCHDDLQATNFL